MSARRRRTERDHRRRSLGQNFLADGPTIERFVADLHVQPRELIVEIGAGRGALTLPIARAGARVLAVEVDPVWCRRLSEVVERAGLGGRVRVVRSDLRSVRLPRGDYRVASSPPYGLTTSLLTRLLDDPERGPRRADLILQRQVAAKHAAVPPVALRTAAWLPWWTFELGPTIHRSRFRPQPSIDSAVLTVRRREPPLLPHRVAPGYRDVLRPAW